MTARQRSGGGMRRKILLLAIIPALSISIILTWYFTSTRQAQLTRDLQLLGHTTAEHLAIAGKLALFADNLESLRQIGLGPSSNPAVTGVAFLDSSAEPVLLLSDSGDFQVPGFSGEHMWQNNQYRGDEIWYFRAPVMLETETMTDYDEAGEGGQELLGWSVIGLSQIELFRAQQENLFAGFVIFAIATIIAGFAAWLIGHQIYQPVRDLTTTVETMEAGDLSVRARVAGEREVRILARVINRLAANLNETNIRLKQEVDEATADLRDAMNAKDEFLARVSHELRTPLTTIIGYTHRLERSTLTAEQAEFSHAIQQSSELLLAVINDILDFSRLQHGGLELESIEFNLETALEDVVAMHASGASEKSIELVLLVDSDVPRYCLGDVVRLKQVVNNLLANAVKFTEQGEIVVHAAMQDESGTSPPAGEKNSGVGMEISVQDTGIGIAPEAMDKLFTSFSQADTSINRRFGGSGLGLVICKQLADLLGGDISLQSQVGEGTRASFSISLRRATGANQHLPIPHREAAVAVVDANRWSRRALRSQVTHWTRQVYALESVQELIDLLDNPAPELMAVLISEPPGAVHDEALQRKLTGLREHYEGPIALMRYMLETPDMEGEGWHQALQPMTLLSKPSRRQSVLQWLDSLEQGDTAETEVQNPLDPASGSLNGIEIVIAEDNQFNQDLFRMVLEQEGATVRVANNGAEALQAFRVSGATLVLMDAHMPEVDGIRASQQIVEEAARLEREVVIVGLTADTSSAEHERFIQAGAVEVLSKPVNEDALIETLCRHAEMAYDGGANRSIMDLDSTDVALHAELMAQLGALRRDLAQGAFEQCREILHQLQGLCGLCGIHDLQHGLQQVKTLLANNELAQAEQKIVELENILLQEKRQARV
ncbi:ATP-binding protein [Pseudohalioglobus sediminis]|nr:ATP-binding protein [Pseudohalioglobus sediminis]